MSRLRLLPRRVLTHASRGLGEADCGLLVRGLPDLVLSSGGVYIEKSWISGADAGGKTPSCTIAGLGRKSSKGQCGDKGNGTLKASSFATVRIVDSECPVDDASVAVDFCLCAVFESECPVKDSSFSMFCCLNSVLRSATVRLLSGLESCKISA